MNTDHRTVSIWIADSQYLIVEALKSYFKEEGRYSIEGISDNKKELVQILNASCNGLLIADIASIDLDNADEFREMMHGFPGIAVLIMTNSVSKTDLVELTRAGFRNIVFKTINRDELTSAIEATLKRKKYYSSELIDLMLDLNMGKQTIEESKALTSSEIEIVKLVSQGFTTKEIAFRKNISFHTVNTHRKNIFRKMEVSNVSELIMKAIKLGWIDNIEYYI